MLNLDLTAPEIHEYDAKADNKRLSWNRGMRGHFMHSPETLRQMSEAHKGRKLSAEAIAKRTKAVTKIHYGKSLGQWSKELGVGTATVRQNLKKGEEHFFHWKELVSKHGTAKAKIHYGKSVKQWAEELGVTREAISAHLKKGEEHFFHWKKLVSKTGSGNKGRKFSAEHRAKMSSAQTKFYYGKSVKQWSEELGVHGQSIRDQLKKGEEGFLAYVKNKKKLQKDVDKHK
jgi:predicted DNA-binding protein YlxM (UPF0122 family)